MERLVYETFPLFAGASIGANLILGIVGIRLIIDNFPRLLEADSKSLRSMNGSRRNSGSSLVSSSSASSNLSHLEEDTWILWGRIVNEWEEWRKKKEKLLKVKGVFVYNYERAYFHSLQWSTAISVLG